MSGTPSPQGPLAQPVQPGSRAGTVLAFDFGERRIGVAVGDLSLAIAHPLATIEAGTDRARVDAVAELVSEWNPILLVIGLPVHMDGSEHELAARCRKFARRLEARFHIATELVDERLTSYAAGQALAGAGIRGRRQKAMIDQVAAQQILETFFSERLRPTAKP
jgi:putative Holliday junction resolvase